MLREPREGPAQRFACLLELALAVEENAEVERDPRRIAERLGLPEVGERELELPVVRVRDATLDPERLLVGRLAAKAKPLAAPRESEARAKARATGLTA
jgi:hypothetical protein